MPENRLTGNIFMPTVLPFVEELQHSPTQVHRLTNYSQTLHDITEGEKKITGNDRPMRGGPTAIAQSILTGVRNLFFIVLYTSLTLS